MCAFCGKLDRNFLCEECNNKLKTIEKFHIDRYNINANIYNIQAKSEERLSLHHNTNYKYYDEHIYLFKYEGYIREKIIDYKFNDKAYYYKSFAKILLNNKKICEILKSYDIIIPVPIHNKRRKERGYNQTELISKELSKQIEKNIVQEDNCKTNREKNLEENKMGLMYANLLAKKINTEPQSKLNRAQRLENSKNVYKLKNREPYKLESIYQKKILIFDDIYTTGSTANECSKVIKELKPKKIGILTIAKD